MAKIKHQSVKQNDSKKSLHRAAFYIRVSTEEQAENPEGSIKNQEERLKAALLLKNTEGHGFADLVGTYIDRARSGKDTNRPELQRLLSAIRRKEITLVMVSELSRLSRSMKDFSEIWELMKANGCSFLSLRENFDTTNAAGEMVLFTLANLAQFERKQIGERVTANIQARAKRGLYNGGPVPLGYQLIPEKRGYLAIEPDQAAVVQAAFQAFLKERTLARAASWLNAQGYRYKKEMQGGGNGKRLGHFTIENLHQILRNKAYIGVKSYRVKNGFEEAKAVWEPIVDPDVFTKVNEILTKNGETHSRLNQTNRYPFLLSGLIRCGQCGQRLSGKVAHGKSQKIPYYEHAWTLKQQTNLAKEMRTRLTCNPCRVLVRKIDPEVWRIVLELLTDTQAAATLITEARDKHAKATQRDEIERVKCRIATLRGRSETLTERLSQLPKELSAEPIFAQMKQIEDQKAAEELRLQELERGGQGRDRPAALQSYQALMDALRALGAKADCPKLKTRIIQTLIDRIEIFPDTFKIHFFTGETTIDWELAHAGSRLFLCLDGDLEDAAGPGELTPVRRFNFFEKKSSNRLTNGVPTGIRTPVLTVKG